MIKSLSGFINNFPKPVLACTMTYQVALLLEGSYDPLNLPFCYPQSRRKHFCSQASILTKKRQHFFLICPDIYADISPDITVCILILYNIRQRIPNDLYSDKSLKIYFSISGKISTWVS